MYVCIADKLRDACFCTMQPVVVIRID